MSSCGCDVADSLALTMYELSDYKRSLQKRLMRLIEKVVPLKNQHYRFLIKF